MNIGTIIIIIVLAVVFLVIVSLASRPKPRGIDKIHFENEWKDIMAMVNDPKTRSMSIIQADRLLDEALKCCGYRGDTMGERLISAKQALKHRDSVWASHKLRNKLVHESMAELSAHEVQRALNGFRDAFNDLRVF
jgi:hypothetical protein